MAMFLASRPRHHGYVDFAERAASCFETIDLMPDAYARVADGDGYRFIVLQGHEEPSIERIVESHDGWLVVEKFGGARAEIERERDG